MYWMELGKHEWDMILQIGCIQKPNSLCTPKFKYLKIFFAGKIRVVRGWSQLVYLVSGKLAFPCGPSDGRVRCFWKKKDCHFIDHKVHIETYGSCNSVLKTRDMAKWYLTYERKNKKSRSISAHFLGRRWCIIPMHLNNSLVQGLCMLTSWAGIW